MKLTDQIQVNITSTIWLIFSFLFLSMTVFEYFKCKKGLKVDKINVGFSDLNDAYNKVNKAIVDSDRSSHKSAALSYLLAFLVALFSFIVSIK